ncbi:HAMP domain-containing sensor histidine kinase [Timonella senegalensis]|uniref:HAMP domain-containing sensor histidine kinase n=1 Tax=Timonella senegalensis TaxID=1465825 RepID=UPI002FDDF4AB
MLNRLSVQNKILATLAVPIIVVLIAATVFSVQSIQDWRRAEQYQQLNALILKGQQFIGVIQNERKAAIDYRAGTLGGEEVWQKSVTYRNAALNELGKEFQGLDSFNLVPEEVRTALEAVNRDLRYNLEAAQDEARRGVATTAVISQRYDDSIQMMLRVATTIGNTAEDRRLGNAALSYVDTFNYLDRVTEEIPRINEALAAVEDADPQARVFAEVATSVRLTNSGRETARLSIKRLDIPGVELATPEAKYTSIRQYLATTNAGAVSSDVAATWTTLAETEVAKIAPVRDKIIDEMDSAAKAWVSSTRNAAFITIGLMVLTLAASLGIAYLISRSITQPLKHLAEAADRVKTELPRLVEQVAVPGQGPDLELTEIKVESRDEVGQLAESFNAVNATTIEVAKEQAALRGSIAEMFVNVARRDHVLLNRQLGFLDELERAEEDPTTLANLFRLDHLATRMRRNSESLLVLAGIDSGRRVRDAMAMSDVVRTASSEIELYDRVQLDLQADPRILGHNALNSAHLIAELLENATNFSEPNTPVEVTTAATKSFVTVTIRDYGLGMSEEDIAEANKKVSSRAASDVVGVQRVGLFVVGRLADRLGVHIAFSRPSDGSNGTVVLLTFPRSLFADDTATPLPEPTDPLVNATQDAAQSWSQAEAPLVAEVDLPSMMDGTTSTGMPRRRVTSASELPSAEPFTPQFADGAQPLAGSLPARGQSAGVSPDLSNDSPEMVLPPLETPFLPVMDDASEGWAPETLHVETRAGLPTRRLSESSPAAAALVEEEFSAPAEPEKRSAMFSNFRSFNPADLQADAASPEVASTPTFGEVPALVEDSNEFIPGFADEQDAAFAPAAVVAEEPVTPVEYQAPVAQATPEAPTVHADQAAPNIAQPAQDLPPSYAPFDGHVPESTSPASWSSSESTSADRFGNLPTRASRAREALLASRSAVEAPDYPEPDHVALEAARADSTGFSAGNTSHAFVPQFEEPDEAAMPQAGSPYTPIAPAEQPSFGLGYGSNDETAQFDASDLIIDQEAPVAQSPAPLAETPANPAHPFTPLSASSAPSPREQATGTDARSAIPHVVATPSFNEMMASATPVQQPKKKGLFARLFGKKDSGALTPHFTPAAPSSNSPFAPVSGAPFGQPATQEAQRSEFTAALQPESTPFGFGAQPESAAPLSTDHRVNSTSPVGANHSVPGEWAVSQPAEPTSALGGFEPRQAPVERQSAIGRGAAQESVPLNSAFQPLPERNTAPQSFTPAPIEEQEPVQSHVANVTADFLPARETAETYSPSTQPSAMGQTTAPASAPAFGVQESHWEPPTNFGDNPAFALQSSIQEQAFAELSELSAYRPNAVTTGGGSNLTRRVRTQMDRPEDDSSAQKISRDAAQLRARLSAFQSATTRGRQDGVASAQSAQGEMGNDLPTRVPDSASSR